MPGLSRVTPEDLYDELRPLHGMAGVCLDDLQSVQHYVDARGSSAPAKHALSAAILDTMAQHRGVSLARLLHTEVRRDVPISHLYEDDDRLFHATMLGTQTVKIKVGIAPLREEVARVSAVGRSSVPASTSASTPTEHGRGRKRRRPSRRSHASACGPSRTP